MGNKSDTSGQQNRTSRINDDIALTVTSGKCHVVISAWSFTIFEFGLCHRSFEIDVPERWCFLCVRLATSQVAQESTLAHATTAVFDGCVEIIPVNRKSKSTEEIFENFFVFVREFFTQFNEIGS